MGLPLFLAENLFSQPQFPGHLLSASEEAVKGEVWRVATGRRSGRDRWTPATPNVASWVQVKCNVARSADMIVLDRGHNLAGVTIGVQYSADGASWTTWFSPTIPSAVGSAASALAANGVVTEEGAWLKQFAAPPSPQLYWRISIPALGAGLVPQIVGLWLGASWQPAHYLGLPYDDDGQQLILEQSDPTQAGWRGAGLAARGKDGELSFALAGEAEYATARYHVRENFHGRNRPMWILHDGTGRAERAVLAVPPPGRLSFRFDAGWHSRQAIVAWVEHEPRMP